MEQSPVVVILLCALCLPGALPSGLGLEIPSGSRSEILSGSRSEIPSGSRSEILSGSRPEILSGSGSEIPSGLRSELPSGLELPSESEPPSGLGLETLSGSEIPSGSELPSGLESELSSGSELPSGLESEIPSQSELPSGLESETPSGSEIPPGSELPSGLESLPLGLKARVVLSSSPCSASCGLGVREEQLCEVSADGRRRNCSLVRSRCLRDWICGLRHLGVPEGRPLSLVCLSPDAAGLEGPNFGYTWRFARGLITTNDLLFRPFRNPAPSLRLSPALQRHSGTYRCDVQVLSSFQLVKRIYFGLRVIPGDLVDLDFQKSLTWEQQLAAGGEEVPEDAGGGAAAWERRPGWWERPWVHEAALGMGSGAIAGILLGFGLRWIRRKRAAGEMNKC